MLQTNVTGKIDSVKERYCHVCHKVKQLFRIDKFGDKVYKSPLFTKVTRHFKESSVCKSCSNRRK